MKKIRVIICLALMIFLSSCKSNNEILTEKTTTVYNNHMEDNYYNSAIVDNPYVNIATTMKTNVKNEIIGDKLSKITFYNKYSILEGVLTFRGNNYRDSAASGYISDKSSRLEKIWSYTTESSSWGGGAGWTGQPLIVKWPKNLFNAMNIYEEFKKKETFIEVIQASLDGNIYFLDAISGKRTREPIRIGNPIKGTPSIDPRGYPLLYVGDGIPEKSDIGFNIFSLIDGSKLYHQPGIDKDAFRLWGAFDSSALFNDDRLIVGGENGLLYIMDLNTDYKADKKTITVNPKVTKYRYKLSEDTSRLGVENSVCAYKNLIYFSDNSGVIQCLDLNTLTPKWIYESGDDTDASLTISVENGVPYIYTGNEVDLQGEKGTSTLRKIDGYTGDVVWQKAYECFSVIGDHAVNGGVLATNIIGKGNIKDYVIFSIARCKTFDGGIIVALNKDTGKEIWNKELKNYMWSSPVDIYGKNGTAYLIQCDSVGNVNFINAENGRILNTINLGANIESSPAVFNDTLVVASRNGTVNAIKIKE